MSLRDFFKRRAPAGESSGSAITDSGTPEEAAWQANYDARQRYFESTVGPFPDDILKMLNMSGVWPGGGLFVVPAGGPDADLAVYTTFGFTNPDMPATTRMTDFELEADGGRAARAGGRLQSKPPVPKRPGAAGYGYEILMVAPRDQYWPIGFLQWAVNAEIGNDVGMLDRVEKYEGLTVQDIAVDEDLSVNVLIAKALPPLPTGTQLPAGSMDLLVAVTITEEEMQWSMQNGRDALLDRLREAGIGQVSWPERGSVPL